MSDTDALEVAAVKCTMLGCEKPLDHHKALCNMHVARVLLFACNPLPAKHDRSAKA